MIKARKGNKVVRIPDEKAGEYKSLGYSLYDENGKAIYIHVKDSEKVKTLEREAASLRQENKSLKEENAKLTAELKKLKAKTKAENGSQKASK